MIVREFDPWLYRARLDRLFSMKEALELPPFIVDKLMRFRVQAQRLTTRGMRRGQVDNALLAKGAREYLRASNGPKALDFAEDMAKGDDLLKERCSLVCIEHLMAMDLNALVERILEMRFSR